MTVQCSRGVSLAAKITRKRDGRSEKLVFLTAAESDKEQKKNENHAEDCIHSIRIS